MEEEMALLMQGHRFVAGVDEAGRGCLAGPVVAAAVMLPLGEDLPLFFSEVRDSKQLSAGARQRLYPLIMQHALDVSIGIGSVELIDEQNILQATKHAMRVAIAQLLPPPQGLLLDAMLLPDIPLSQRAIIKGDVCCLSIAAASIIAKVTRDTFMMQLHEQYPAYGFHQHKGYGTAAHMQALRLHGVTSHHRKSFAPIYHLLP